MRQFNLSAQTEWQLPLRYNIAPTQTVAVIVAAEQERELEMMRWGLIPSWSKDPSSGPPLHIARSETVAEKPSFRTALKRRRCLIPVDGFYEWKKEGKLKVPYYFRRPDEQPFAFAGVWDQWQDTKSCALLTTTPNGLMAPLHDRMPVILSPNDYDFWLDTESNEPASLGYLYEPFPDSELIATPVSTFVNNAKHEGPECIAAPVKDTLF